jgi:hypothetical protein
MGPAAFQWREGCSWRAFIEMWRHVSKLYAHVIEISFHWLNFIMFKTEKLFFKCVTMVRLDSIRICYLGILRVCQTFSFLRFRFNMDLYLIARNPESLYIGNWTRTTLVFEASDQHHHSSKLVWQRAVHHSPISTGYTASRLSHSRSDFQ